MQKEAERTHTRVDNILRPVDRDMEIALWIQPTPYERYKGIPLPLPGMFHHQQETLRRAPLKVDDSEQRIACIAGEEQRIKIAIFQ